MENFPLAPHAPVSSAVCDFSPNPSASPPRREIQDYIPPQFYHLQKAQAWLDMVAPFMHQAQALSAHQARAQFLGKAFSFQGARKGGQTSQPSGMKLQECWLAKKKGLRCNSALCFSFQEFSVANLPDSLAAAQ